MGWNMRAFRVAAIFCILGVTVVSALCYRTTIFQPEVVEGRSDEGKQQSLHSLSLELDRSLADFAEENIDDSRFPNSREFEVVGEGYDLYGNLILPRHYTAFSEETYEQIKHISPRTISVLSHISFFLPGLSEEQLLGTLKTDAVVTDSYVFNRIAVAHYSLYEWDALITWERDAIGGLLDDVKLEAHLISIEHKQLVKASIDRHLNADPEGYIRLNLAGKCIPDVMDGKYYYSDERLNICLSRLDKIYDMAAHSVHSERIATALNEFRSKIQI